MARPSRTKQREQRRLELERQRREEARKKTIRTFGITAAVVFVLTAALVAFWPRRSAEEVAADKASNTTATAWDLPQLDGDGRVTLADFRGKPTVAAFFANWCTVCEWEVPELLAFSEQVGDQINFVGIDMMDNGGGLEDAEEWGIVGKWPLARDVGNGNGSLLSAGTFGARGSPLNVLYSPDGEVLHVQPGAISTDQILSVFAQYL
jgi:cytochrome c biogenesis protein CcmG/thiol:disulfide interchange protein DsbE